MFANELPFAALNASTACFVFGAEATIPGFLFFPMLMIMIFADRGVI